MASKNDEKWLANFEVLKAYIDEHHHLTAKHKVDNRSLFNRAINPKEDEGRDIC